MCVTELANPGLVCKSVSHDDTGTNLHQSQRKTTHPTKSLTRNTSNLAKINPYNLPLVRKKLEKYDLSVDENEIIMASWRTGASKQYETYLDKWQTYLRNGKLMQLNQVWRIQLSFLLHCTIQV